MQKLSRHATQKRLIKLWAKWCSTHQATGNAADALMFHQWIEKNDLEFIWSVNLGSEDATDVIHNHAFVITRNRRR